MQEQPNGESLLQCARDVLKNNVLPLLEGDAKRDVLMAMNAMSIAQRELQHGAALYEAEQLSLATVFGQSVPNVSLANQDLAARIRAGFADPGQLKRAAVLAHLRVVGQSRLEVSNPKALKR